jgi:transcriptional regulator with XRE-family HTH domain
MAHRPFSELRVKMSPEAQRRSQEMANEMLAEMELGELREALKITQEDIAKKLKTKQGAISRLENRKNIKLETLGEYIEGLGGRLELRAVFADRSVGLTQALRNMSDGTIRISAKTKISPKVRHHSKSAARRAIAHA